MSERTFSRVLNVAICIAVILLSFVLGARAMKRWQDDYYHGEMSEREAKPLRDTLENANKQLKIANEVIKDSTRIINECTDRILAEPKPSKGKRKPKDSGYCPPEQHIDWLIPGPTFTIPAPEAEQKEKCEKEGGYWDHMDGSYCYATNPAICSSHCDPNLNPKAPAAKPQ